MLHHTFPGCINTEVKTVRKLLEHFLTVKILLKQPDRKEGMQYTLPNVALSFPGCTCATSIFRYTITECI